MSQPSKPRFLWPTPGPWLPLAAALVALVTLTLWILRGPGVTTDLRRPGTDLPPGVEGVTGGNPVPSGKVTPGDGQATPLPGTWTGFRGPRRDGIAHDASTLARSWPPNGPKTLWALDLGEGYAGAAVRDGRVYLLDYDRERKQDALRCLSLADGREIWRFSYAVPVKRNHGMSRTVPALSGSNLVTLGPKCHVACLDANTGSLRWSLDLVRQFGTTVPPWYAGQCPLIHEDQVILAPAGKETLLTAVSLTNGQPAWTTPNPRGWKMTHSSIVAMSVDDLLTYVYCGSHGVAGVDARDGTLLWESLDWKISIANVPSPVPLPGNRLFLSGGYNAGSLMLELSRQENKITPKTLFRLDPEVFGATQQTPIFHAGHLFGVRPDGRFTCLDLTGKPTWTSPPSHAFGLGPFLLADGLFLVLNDSGRLSLLEASPARFAELAQARILDGRESWGPLALAGTRLVARDLTRMVCVELGPQ